MPATVYWLREAVRRNPADEQAHYILGVALQASGSTAEGTREKELARRLSSVFAEWEKQPATPVPRGLERIKTEVDVPAALRVENVIVAAGQRDQQELAAIHLESGRRLSLAERDVEAISELRRAIYLAPYQHEAHLLLGEIYLRGGRIDEAVDELKISVWSQDTVPARVRLAEAYIAAQESRPRSNRASDGADAGPGQQSGETVADAVALIQFVAMAEEEFHEIQLNGKQLVFLFMAGTVAAVVIFLCGLHGGPQPARPEARGGRSQRLKRSRDPTQPVDDLPPAPASINDGTPPATTREKLTYPEQLAAPKPVDEPLRTLIQQPPRQRRPRRSWPGRRRRLPSRQLPKNRSRSPSRPVTAGPFRCRP